MKRSRYEILRDRLRDLNLERARVVAEMEKIEGTYRARHPEVSDDEFEQLLLRSAR